MKKMRMTSLLAPALLLGLVFFGCKSKAPGDGPAPATAPTSTSSADVRLVATVDGDPVTLAEFLERFNRAGYKPEHGDELEMRKEFLNRLIERKMMLREAQRRRIKVGLPEINKRIAVLQEEHGKDVKEILASEGVDFEKWKSDIWEDLMLERLLAMAVNRNVTVTPAEVKRYYQANPAEFEKPDQVRVRQIVVATEDEAKKILQQLEDKKTDFAELAKQKSTAPEAENGGDLGYFSQGQMPAEFNVVFTMPKGGTSGVIKSAYGFHIFHVVDRRRAGKIGLEEAYKEIASKLRKEKEDNRFQVWIRELRSRTKFEVNYQALQQ